MTDWPYPGRCNAPRPKTDHCCCNLDVDHAGKHRCHCGRQWEHTP